MASSTGDGSNQQVERDGQETRFASLNRILRRRNLKESDSEKAGEHVENVLT